MKPIDRIVSTLHARPTGLNQWEACCPAHDDQQASLSISQGTDGRVLLNCHAGCCVEDVVHAAGLQMSHLFPVASAPSHRTSPPPHRPKQVNKPVKPVKPPSKPPVPVSLERAVNTVANRLCGTESDRWYYHDNEGQPTACVVRYETPKGKTYRPFHKTGPAWQAGGIDGRRPLYRLQELRAAKGRVYVVEGEKATDAACDIGLVATTSMHGANSPVKTDWTPLAGRDVVILPDRDSSGRKYANVVTNILAELSPPANVKIVELPDLPSHGDIVDFIDAQRATGLDDEGIRSRVDELVTSAKPALSTKPTTRPVLIPLSEVKPEETEWLWPRRIPLGKLTMIAGDPGLGKSFATLDVAARVSMGTPWPDQPSTAMEAGGVLIINVEDDNADTVVPRLIAANADLSRIVAFNSVELSRKDKITERLFTLEADMPWLEQAMQSVPGLRLVIIDPVSAFVGKTDSNNNAETRGMLAPLAALAAKYRAAILCVSHLNKNANGSPIYRTIGSIGQVAAARAAFGVVRDKCDRTRRLFLPMKNNLAPDEDGLAYKIVDGDDDGAAHVEWESVPVDISADEAFRDERYHGGESADRTEAETFIRDLLTDGPVPANAVFKAARNNGISISMVKKVKGSLGVRSKKIGFTDGTHWAWSLPSSEQQGTSTPQGD